MSDFANEPAFPIANCLGEEEYGLTRLEWFAGQALQGMCAYNGVPETATCDIQERARFAFDLAEAMCQEAKRRRK